MTTLRIMPTGGWWTLFLDSEDVGLFSDKDKARAYARELAPRRGAGFIVLFDRDGREVQRETVEQVSLKGNE